MSSSLLILLLSSCILQSEQCGTKRPIDSLHGDFRHDRCVSNIALQTATHVKASMVFMQLSISMRNVTNYRPGLAQYFVKLAVVERMAVSKLLDHLITQKGDLEYLTKDLEKLVNDRSIQGPDIHLVTDTMHALQVAHDMKKMANNLLSISIAKCQQGLQIKPDQKVESVQISEAEILAVNTLSSLKTIQSEHLQEMAAIYSGLDAMSTTHGALGQIIFDKSLLDKMNQQKMTQ